MVSATLGLHEYACARLAARSRGTEYLPPEILRDTTPIIRDHHTKRIKPVTPSYIHRLIHNLYAKAGLIDTHNPKTWYRLRPHSIRKFFRTQLGSVSTLPTDYIEYMMGHTISTYNDIQMKGIEFLRSRYAAANLQIKRKDKADIYNFIEDLLRSKGYGIDKILLRQAIVKSHRTVYDPRHLDEQRRTAIRETFLDMLQKEFLASSLE